MAASRLLREHGLGGAQIAVEYERMGMSPDEIVDAHPHLTLAQAHDALSYYYENVEEINAEIRAGEQSV